MAEVETRVRTRRELADVFEDMVALPAFFLAVVPIVIGLVLVGAGALVTGGNGNDRDQVVQAFTHAADYVNVPEAPAERQERATDLLSIYESNIGTDLKTNHTTQADEDLLVAGLQHTSQTGDRLDLTLEPFEWDTWRAFLYWTIAAIAALWSCGIFLAYAWETAAFTEWFDYGHRYSKRFLWDLPWRHVWPVIFILLTPIGWPFYLVSTVRYGLAMKNGQRREETLLYRDWCYDYRHLTFQEYLDRYHRRQAERDIPYAAEPERRQRDRAPDYTPYQSAEHAARSTYLKLRQEAGTTDLRRRASEADSIVECSEATLRELGEQVRSVQTRLGKQRAEHTKLTRLLKEAEAQTGTLSTDDLEREFDRIMAITGVTGVRVVGQELCFLLENAHTEYAGHAYDLGDWELRFGVGTNLKTRLLRDPTTGGRGSFYLNGDNSFCMGTRASEINSHLQRGQFLGAVELAVATIQSVNSSHESHIPEFYQRVKVMA